VGTLVLALGLTAPLWLPFLAESSAVGIGLGPSDGYLRHLAPLGRFIQPLLLYHYGLERGGAADHPLSWLTVVLFVAVLGLFAWRSFRRQPVQAAPVVGFSLGLTAAAALMATTASLPIWLGTAPILAQLQYPWRFLALTNLGVLGLAGALPRLVFPKAGIGGNERSTQPAQGGDLVRRSNTRHTPLLRAGLVVIIAGLIVAQALPLVPAQALPLPEADAWAPDRMWREDADAGQVGATWTGEFLPLSVSEQRWALGRSRPNAVDGQAPNSFPDVQLNRLGYLFTELATQTKDPITLRLHQFDLPGWGARVDGQAVPTYPSGELGLVSVDVPSGAHEVRLAFGATPARAVAMGLAVASAILWGVLAWRGRRSGRGLGAASVVIWSMALLFGLNSLGVGQRSWQPRPVKAAVEDVALLLGYDVARAPGEDALDVTLYWFALRDIGTDFKVFVHLLDQGGQVVSQHDGDPVGGFTPTTRWRSGELIADRHRLPLPASLPDGNYALKAGMYQFQPLRNLLIEPATSDGRIYLGDVAWR
jgi:hypothetical protein